MKVSIITGCYNDGGNLPEFIESVYTSLSNAGINDFEILIVDESSDHTTAEKIDELKSRYEKIRVIRNSNRSGLLASEMEGIGYSVGNFKIVMDCDMQHDPFFISSIIDGLKDGNNIVIMSRFIEGASFTMNYYRYALSKLAGILCRILLPYSRGIRDPTSGFYGLSGNLEFRMPDFMGTKSLLYIIALNPGVKLIEKPYHFRERKNGKSKILRPSIFFSFMYEVVQYHKTSRNLIDRRKTFSQENSRGKTKTYHKL